MKNYNKYILIFIFLIFQNSMLMAQAKDPVIILENIKTKFDLIQSYKANTLIKVDVDFIRVPERKAEIRFKQPDDIKIKVKGFALLPKPGLDFSPASLLKEDFTPIYLRNEIRNNVNLAVLQIVPRKQDSEILISTLWIDENRNIIRRIETATRKEGIYNIDLFYPKKANYFDMPDSLHINFELKRTPLPMGLTGDISGAGKKKEKGPVEGKVTLIYIDYLINENQNREGKKLN